MNLLQILTLSIPILSALIIALITYRFAIKSKKFDLLYASKIPAFKEIAAKLTDFRLSCLGKVAEYKGLEFSPYLVTSSVLIHRGYIAAVTDANAIFLSKDNREKLTKLMDNMGKLCSLELRLAGNPDDTGDA